MREAAETFLHFQMFLYLLHFRAAAKKEREAPKMKVFQILKNRLSMTLPMGPEGYFRTLHYAPPSIRAKP